MRADLRTRIGSVTKTLTAAALLGLAGEGRISLDAPVHRYLPGLIDRNGYDGRTITVRSLLRHTSGLPDHMDTFETIEEFRFRHFEPAELVERALALPRPETRWHYSTTNYIIAGLLVEKVTGRTLEDEVRHRIIGPLRLRDTYWPGDETRIRGRMRAATSARSAAGPSGGPTTRDHRGDVRRPDEARRDGLLRPAMNGATMTRRLAAAAGLAVAAALAVPAGSAAAEPAARPGRAASTASTTSAWPGRRARSGPATRWARSSTRPGRSART